MTTLQKLREVCSKRTPGKWVGVNVHGYCHAYEDGNVPIGGMRNNAFVEAASEHFETLLKIAEAAKLRLKAGHNDTCAYMLSPGIAFDCTCGDYQLCAALAKLDGRGDD